MGIWAVLSYLESGRSIPKEVRPREEGEMSELLRYPMESSAPGLQIESPNRKKVSSSKLAPGGQKDGVARCGKGHKWGGIQRANNMSRFLNG
jgi:hypothetical protein